VEILTAVTVINVFASFAFIIFCRPFTPSCHVFSKKEDVEITSYDVAVMFPSRALVLHLEPCYYHVHDMFFPTLSRSKTNVMRNQTKTLAPLKAVVHFNESFADLKIRRIP
jgi:hypothetical protein